jgi:hypothetical protein
VTDVRIASYNVENLFARPRAFGPNESAEARAVVKAHAEFNALIANAGYSTADKSRMRDLLVLLDIYTVNNHGAIRRKETSSLRWAWLRKNRGSFDRQPEDNTKNIEITANGRENWIGGSNWRRFGSERGVSAR